MNVKINRRWKVKGYGCAGRLVHFNVVSLGFLLLWTFAYVILWTKCQPSLCLTNFCFFFRAQLSCHLLWEAFPGSPSPPCPWLYPTLCSPRFLCWPCLVGHSSHCITVVTATMQWHNTNNGLFSLLYLLSNSQLCESRDYACLIHPVSWYIRDNMYLLNEWKNSWKEWFSKLLSDSNNIYWQSITY